MKHEAANADKKVSKVRDCEHVVVAMLPAALEALVSKPYEHKIGQCIDDFSRVIGGIVVLPPRSACTLYLGRDPRHTSSHQFKVEVTGSQ